MKNKFQYIMAGAGITLLVIFGALTFLLSRAQAGEAPQNTFGQTESSMQSVQSSVAEVIPLDNQDEPDRVTNDTTETQTASMTIRETPTEEFLASLGTKEKPQTNMDIIVYTVSELARKQEEAFLGQPGWFHVKWQMIFPEGQKGSGYHSATTGEIIPMEVLVPENPVFDSWYHVNETGHYREALSLVMAPDGTIHQQSVLMDGTWTNLTLKALDTHLNQYETSNALAIAASPTSEAFRALEKSRTWSGISMQAYLENGQYIVIKEQRHDLIEDTGFMPEPVIGNREIHIFDQATGQLLSSEVQSLLQSETWVSVGEKTYLTIELMSELPMEISQLFSDSMDIFEGGK